MSIKRFFPLRESWICSAGFVGFETAFWILKNYIGLWFALPFALVGFAFFAEYIARAVAVHVYRRRLWA